MEWDASEMFNYDEYSQALRGIDAESHCRGVPFVFLKALANTPDQSVLALQNLSWFLAVSTKDWHDQDNYHEYKPGRERQ